MTTRCVFGCEHHLAMFNAQLKIARACWEKKLNLIDPHASPFRSSAPRSMDVYKVEIRAPSQETKIGK